MTKTLTKNVPEQKTSECASQRVWSATPTPLTSSGKIDVASMQRVVTRHVAMGCEGMMLAGTCGEGPWLRRADIEVLVRTGIELAGESIQVAVQVTDNSPGLILERLEMLARWGVKMGVVAQPYFFLNSTPSRLREFYLEIWKQSPLPVLFYDRGKNATVPVPLEILEEVVSHPKVIGVKDSASERERFEALKSVRRRRPEFRIFTGDEFRLMEMLRAGYDGAFTGGAIITARALQKCMELFFAGEFEEAEKLDEEIKQVLLDIYGGPKIMCWLAGLKYSLIRLGVFTEWINIPGYLLTDDCRKAIDRVTEQVEWLQEESLS
ncbi:MAG: dihydrodipicolinate synthase family protein [Terrimicrobiaceae bacterium]